MSTTFIVYELWNPIKNLPFYVGKTRFKSYRFQDHLYEAKNYKKGIKRKNGNPFKCNTINKIIEAGYSIEYKIVFQTENELIAYDKEKELINLYGRRNDKSRKDGILTNITDGGNGSFEYSITQQLRDKFSKQRIGQLNAMFGKHHSEETRKRISQIINEKLKSGEIIPTKHTEEHKQKLRTDNKGGKATARPIHQICPKTGEIIQTHNSSQSAAKLFNGSKGNINSCTKTYKNRLCYGFYWRFVDDAEESYPLDVFILNEKRDNKYRSSKKVIQLDKNKQFIKEWESASAVCRYLNKNVGNLNFYITRNKMYCDYYWKFVDDYYC